MSSEFEDALQNAAVAYAGPLDAAFRTLNDVATRTDAAARESVVMANRNGFGAMMDAMVADGATYGSTGSSGPPCSAWTSQATA
jgi:hypothetical protein